MRVTRQMTEEFRAYARKQAIAAVTAYVVAWVLLALSAGLGLVVALLGLLTLGFLIGPVLAIIACLWLLVGLCILTSDWLKEGRKS